MIITEEEKEDILQKYEGNHSKEVLVYLKRNFPVYEFNLRLKDSPYKQILVGEKLYGLSNNKKLLVNKISYEIEELFPSIEKSELRRTVKYYLDILK